MRSRVRAPVGAWYLMGALPVARHPVYQLPDTHQHAAPPPARRRPALLPVRARRAVRAGAARALTISRAVRTHDAIKLDGRLDEPAWSTAPVTDAFTQMDPDEGKPASQRTEVRVLYDDAALYVGVR